MTIPPRDDDQVIVTTKGEVSEAAKAYAASKVGRLHQHAHGPVLLTRVKLTYAEGEDVERNAIAEAAMDVDGRLVRGQVATHRIEEAVDLLVDRMIRQLDQASAPLSCRPQALVHDDGSCLERPRVAHAGLMWGGSSRCCRRGRGTRWAVTGRGCRIATRWTRSCSCSGRGCSGTR